MEEYIDKARTLLEALPYIQRFSGATFVIKYGGSFMESPDLEMRTSVARDIVFLEAVEINPVVVHGGGKAISRALKASGLEFEFVHGHRKTEADAVEIVDRVLSREINPEIVECIRTLGGDAEGFSGTDIFTCEKSRLVGEGGEELDLGFVGRVVGVKVEPLMECIERGVTPVISPTARGRDGNIYNCNADVAAAQAAIALGAMRLVYMSDVPGLMRDPENAETLISVLSADEVPALKAGRVIGRGMIPKVDSAIEAIRAGVNKVSLVDGRVPHAVLLEIFTDRGVGTQVTS